MSAGLVVLVPNRSLLHSEGGGGSTVVTGQEQLNKRFTLYLNHHCKSMFCVFAFLCMVDFSNPIVAFTAIKKYLFSKHINQETICQFCSFCLFFFLILYFLTSIARELYDICEYCAYQTTALLPDIFLFWFEAVYKL